MAVSDKKPMSRLMKLANKFNCFYLSGKWKRRAVLALFRIVSIDASAGRMIDRNARLPSVRTAENIDFECCVYLPLAFPFRNDESNSEETCSAIINGESRVLLPFLVLSSLVTCLSRKAAVLEWSSTFFVKTDTIDIPFRDERPLFDERLGRVAYFRIGPTH